MVVERSLLPRFPHQHLPRRRARRRGVLRRRRRPRGAADRGGRAARDDPDARAAHPPPLRPRLRARRAARALAGPRGADPPPRARRRFRRPPATCSRASRSRSAACRSPPCTRPATPRGCSRSSSTGEVFTGDTLFKGSVGGVRAPGSTSYADLQGVDHGRPDAAAARDGRTPRSLRCRRRSAMSGSATASSASGAASTPRARSRAPRSASPATLVLLGDDYDGGHKAWVRWPDGRDDIVPGSQVSDRLTPGPPWTRATATRLTSGRPTRTRCRRRGCGAAPCSAGWRPPRRRSTRAPTPRT